jgi:hypothetical protein
LPPVRDLRASSGPADHPPRRHHDRRRSCKRFRRAKRRIRRFVEYMRQNERPDSGIKFSASGVLWGSENFGNSAGRVVERRHNARYHHSRSLGVGQSGRNRGKQRDDKSTIVMGCGRAALGTQKPANGLEISLNEMANRSY